MTTVRPSSFTAPRAIARRVALLLLMGALPMAAHALTPVTGSPGEQFDADWAKAHQPTPTREAPPSVAPVGAVLPGAPPPSLDLPYGPDLAQTLDVYRPVQPLDKAPVLVVVHGGAWRTGDKRNAAAIATKARHWAQQGFVVVSVNYRLLPQAGPLAQAEDVARAVAFVQQQARVYGLDPNGVVLMGHSSGAHLVALLTASPDLLRAAGAQPVKGAVLLDSAALDVGTLMQRPHALLYDAAFGHDPQGWSQASPAARLRPGTPPLLLVCSTQRIASCPQANGYAQRVQAQGDRATVVPVDLDHEGINRAAGEPGEETVAIDRFIASLPW